MGPGDQATCVLWWWGVADEMRHEHFQQSLHAHRQFDGMFVSLISRRLLLGSLLGFSAGRCSCGWCRDTHNFRFAVKHEKIREGIACGNTSAAGP